MTQRKANRLVAGLVSLAFASLTGLGPAHADDIVVKHRQGEITLARTPVKVVTFDLATLDTLQALGVDVAGVPVGNKPDYLKSYEDDRYVKVGSLFEPDYEAVNAAAPDLIIVAGRSAAKYADLARIAPTIDLSIDTNHYLASAKTNVATLASIFGKTAEAEGLIARLDTATAALKAKAGGAGKGLLVLTTGGKMSAYGPGSRFGVLHGEYGILPASDNMQTGNHGQAISFEFILETNPDWLFVIDRDAAIGRDGASARQFLDNEVVRQTDAWKNGKVVYLDAVSWYLVGGGITSMQKTVDQLTNALNAG